MNNKITHLGIDIGGAHLKIVGLDKKGIIIFVEYLSCKIWKGTKRLEELFHNLNNIFPDGLIKCAITITAELCDNFANRNVGARELIKLCQILKFEKYFYVNNFSIFKKKPNVNDFISMNWHAIGKFMEKKVNDAIVLDFGSTTTDFICIKNNKIIKKYFDDFSRINNCELLYTGFTRTPAFGVSNHIKIDNKVLTLIPENFSEMSDIYRVLNKLSKERDIDVTSDNRGKSKRESLIRISRSFGLDYKENLKTKLEKICYKISSIQLNKIKKILIKLRKKFFSKSPIIVISGIGQDVVYEFLRTNKFKTIYLHEFLEKSKLNKKASFHAPALSVALILRTLKKLDNL